MVLLCAHINETEEHTAATSFSVFTWGHLLICWHYLLIFESLVVHYCVLLSHNPMRGTSLCTMPFISLQDHIKPLHTVLDSYFPQAYWSGFCSETVVNCCVCGSFEVVSDGLEYSAEDRNLGEICLTVFLCETEKFSTDGERSSIQGATRRRKVLHVNQDPPFRYHISLNI